MCRRIIAMILTGAICVTAPQPAFAGRRDPKTPTTGVRVTTSGSTVRYTVNREGKPGAGSARCRVWCGVGSTGRVALRATMEPERPAGVSPLRWRFTRSGPAVGRLSRKSATAMFHR